MNEDTDSISGWGDGVRDPQRKAWVGEASSPLLTRILFHGTQPAEPTRMDLPN